MDTSGAFKMIRCINWASQHGQKTRNKILTDHFLLLLGIGCARCPKGAKNGAIFYPPLLATNARKRREGEEAQGEGDAGG